MITSRREDLLAGSTNVPAGEWLKRIAELLCDIRDLLKAIVANTDWGPGPSLGEVGKLLARRAELEALVTEREGMLAENWWDITQSNPPTYPEKAFSELATRMRALGEG